MAKHPRVEVVDAHVVDRAFESSEQLRQLARTWRARAEQLRSAPINTRTFLGFVEDVIGSTVESAQADAFDECAAALEALVGE